MDEYPNATKLRDAVDAMLDEYANRVGAEAQQTDADMVYEALVSQLHLMVGETSREFAAGYRAAIEALAEYLPPSDEIREQNPMPEQ